QLPEQSGPHNRRLPLPKGHPGERPRLRFRCRCRAPRAGPCDQPHSAHRHGNVQEGIDAMTQQTATRSDRTSTVNAPRPRMTRRTATLIQSAFLIVIALVSLVPVLGIFVGTFQDGNDVIRNGISFSIDFSELSLDNYVMLFTDSGMYFQWFWNSLMLTVIQVV